MPDVDVVQVFVVVVVVVVVVSVAVDVVGLFERQFKNNCCLSKSNGRKTSRL